MANGTSPSATEAARLLGAAGWISDRQGKLDFVRDHGCVIGLDLGGTKLRGAISDAGGRVFDEIEQQTGNDAPDSALGQIVEMAKTLAARTAVPLDRIEHIAVGVPGVIDPEGRVALSPNVSFHPQTNVVQTLRAALQRPVSVDNDGNLSAFGEFKVGRGREHGGHSLVFLAIGTGVGMGLINDGRLLRGSRGGAGEIAFIPFGPDPFTASRVNPGGAFEAAVGSDGIRSAYMARTGKQARVREIFDLAEAGDKDAEQVVDRLMRDVALGLGTVIALLDPGLVVVGGGVGARPGVAAAIEHLTAQLTSTPCRVVPSALGDRAGVVGAVAFARHQATLRLIEDRNVAPGDRVTA
ncbi:MAG: ROK family protein [Devosia sp.]